MDTTTISTIIIGATVAIISVLSSSAKSPKRASFSADKAEWYYNPAMYHYCKNTGKNPEDLDESDIDAIWNNACNHCSIFLTWAIMRNYCGDIHTENEPEALEKVKRREMTGTEFFIRYCDCTLSREDFSDSILPFLDAYYTSLFLEIYIETTNKTLKKEPLAFGFCWDDYDVFESILDKAYKRWKFWNARYVIFSK